MQDEGQAELHSANEQAWAADHLQVLNQPQARDGLNPKPAVGSSEAHCAAPQSVQTAQLGTQVGPQTATAQPDSSLQMLDPQSDGQPQSEAQQPLPASAPSPRHTRSCQAKSSARQQAKADVSSTAVGAADSALAPAQQAANAVAVTVQPATAVAQPATAISDPATTAAQPATAAADMATASDAAVSDHATKAKAPVTAQGSAKRASANALRKHKDKRPLQAGAANAAGQTRPAAQASDSPAPSSLQSYLAIASPGSISRLKQGLGKLPAPVEDSAAEAEAAATGVYSDSPVQSALPHGNLVPTAAAKEHALDPPLTGSLPETATEAFEPENAAAAAAAAAADAAQLHAMSHQGLAEATEEGMSEAAGQLQPAAAAAADSAVQVGEGWEQDPRIEETIRQFHAMKKQIAEFSLQLENAAMKQKFDDLLAGKTVPPAPALVAESSSDDVSDSSSDADSSSDSDAGPDRQDTAAVLTDVTASRVVPPRQSSSRSPKPNASQSASDASFHRQAQHEPVTVPKSPGLYPAQASTMPNQAIRLVGDLHSSNPHCPFLATWLDQADASLPNQATDTMLDQALPQARGLSARVAKKNKQTSLPEASALLTGHALPKQATTQARDSKLPSGRKRPARGDALRLDSLDPGTL